MQKCENLHILATWHLAKRDMSVINSFGPVCQEYGYVYYFVDTYGRGVGIYNGPAWFIFANVN